MTHPNEFTVSDGAVRQARTLGFWVDTEARVRGLAAHAAPTTHTAGNATYGPYVLLIQNRHVMSVTMIGPQHVDHRPVSECKICRGMMAYPFITVIDGKEGTAQRPCPRAFDTSKPLCDTKGKNSD